MDKPVEPVSEEAIEVAERRSTAHFHDGVVAEDGSLETHLREVHLLEVAGGLSASTLTGLHDRVHDEEDAADD